VAPIASCAASPSPRRLLTATTSVSLFEQRTLSVMLVAFV
jgi:hypothetical protein